MADNVKQIEAIQNVADAIEQIAGEMYNSRDEASQFNGYSISDSMGFIADAIVTISQTYEEDCKRKWAKED